MKYDRTERKVVFCDFGKFKADFQISLAWTLLNAQGRSKAAFAKNAISYVSLHYNDGKELTVDDVELNVSRYYISSMMAINRENSINKVEDVIDLLDMDAEDPRYQEICNYSMDEERCAKAICFGFSPDDEALRKSLASMKMDDRVYLVSACIMIYVEDGVAPRTFEIVKNTFLKTYINKYRKYNEKDRRALAENFYIISKAVDKLRPTVDLVRPEVNGGRMTNELFDLLTAASGTRQEDDLD